MPPIFNTIARWAIMCFLGYLKAKGVITEQEVGSVDIAAWANNILFVLGTVGTIVWYYIDRQRSKLAGASPSTVNISPAKLGLLLACLMPLGFMVGCAEYKAVTDTISTTSASTNLVIQNGAQVTAYGFTCWVLSRSNGDTADLADKGEILDNVVKGLTVYKSQGASAATVANGLVTMLPAKEHWQTFKDALSSSLSALSADSVKSAITGFIAGIAQAKSDFGLTTTATEATTTSS